MASAKFQKQLKSRIVEMKKKLAAAKSPERKKALKAELKLAKRIVALKKKLHEAPRALRAIIRAKIAKTKASLKRATQKVSLNG